VSGKAAVVDRSAKRLSKKFPPPQMSGKSVCGVRIVLPTISSYDFRPYTSWTPATH